jgi:hypothetical protein
MRYMCAALRSAAATCLLPFATPAIAELGHPSGCLSCAPVEVPGPTPDYNYQGAPVSEPLLAIGGPPAARALKPEIGRHRHSRANRCHVKNWNATYPREYHACADRLIALCARRSQFEARPPSENQSSPWLDHTMVGPGVEQSPLETSPCSARRTSAGGTCRWRRGLRSTTCTRILRR